MAFDPETLRAFEHAGWQRAARHYDTTFAVATREFAEALLDAAAVDAGTRTLDLCCGTGLLAGTAAARGAIVTGLDFSLAMLDVARAAQRPLDFAEGDAEAMPFPEASFDAVVSSFGVHHVPHPDRALAEARRVLGPGGTIAFATWAAPADNIAWKLLLDAIQVHGDRNAARMPISGGGLNSADAVVRLLSDTGFAKPGAELVRREWRLEKPGDLIAALRRGTVRTAALIDAQHSAALFAIEAEIARQAGAYRRDGWYRIPIAAIIGRGVMPQ